MQTPASRRQNDNRAEKACLGVTVYLSAISVGKLRRGVKLIRHRVETAALLKDWLNVVLEQYAKSVLPSDDNVAQLWGVCGFQIPNTGSTTRSARWRW